MKNKIAVLSLVLTLAAQAVATSSNAAIFLIAPPAWGGVLAGAGILAAGAGGFHLGSSIKNPAARGTVRILSVLVGIVGFLVMDDNSVQPVLNEFPANSSDPVVKEIVEANGISTSDIETYNRERLIYQSVIESVFSDQATRQLSGEQRSQRLLEEANAAGVSPSTIRVAGLVDALAQKASQ